LNPSYTGQDTNTAMLDETKSKLKVGQMASIYFKLIVDFADAKVDSFSNSAAVSAKAGIIALKDMSNDGMILDPDNDKNPYNDSKSTVFKIQSDNVSIEPEPEAIVIPDGFSPNNDGINDYFVIKGLTEKLKANVMIFDRWGSLMYESTDYQNDWNGKCSTCNNTKTDLMSGTYYYQIITSDGKRFIRYLTLAR
jgi:large repetitive protein